MADDCADSPAVAAHIDHSHIAWMRDTRTRGSSVNLARMMPRRLVSADTLREPYLVGLPIALAQQQWKKTLRQTTEQEDTVMKVHV